MPAWGGVRAAAQHHLVDHELAVVLPERALRCAVARIRQIGAAGPLPDHGEGILEEIGGDLPLCLGGKLLAGPAGERVGLVIAYMGDRGARIERLQPGECDRHPFAVTPLPLAGRAPAYRLRQREAVRQPERRRRVAAVIDEGEPIGVGYQSAGDASALQIDLMCRLLVVEAEAAAGKSDAMQ